ncbi:MAG: hypothetical protein A2V83_07850 [Nitrospirae bacterium RBG_16_64_22]|nr:MAG: hypothetical protein A2V83_07850 [Nitrospirae bacterium RBG_16_64_22]
MSALTIVHTEASTGWGGQEIRIVLEAVGLRGRGHDVRVVGPAGGAIIQRARDVDVPAEEWAWNGAAGWFSIPRLAGRLDSLRADVVVTHSSRDSWVASLAARIARSRPAVVRMRHLSTPVSTGILTRWLYTRLADVIVTTSEAIRRTLIERNGYPPERLVAVPTHIDPAGFDRPDARTAARGALGIGQDAFVLGTVSVLRSWKGHDLLLGAARSLGAAIPGVRIVIVGDGPQGERLRARVEDEGLSEIVTMTGHREDIGEMLSAFDLFAFPSTANEGVPQAVLQAMSAGLPVVASSLPSIAEVVREEETGFLFPPGDASAFSGRIVLLAGDAALRRRMGEAGKARVRERFMESGMLDRLEEVYGRAASGRGRGGR